MPEIGFNKVICNKCGKCAQVCPQKAIVLDENGLPRIDRARCTACGECITACSPQALAIYGRDISLEELFKEVQSDAIFYSNSGGGVTVSGGEPLLQADFIEALFGKCREANITTAMETCGNINPETLRRILRRVDFLFFDLKAANEQKHLELTSKSNRLILDNARIVAKSAVPVQFRMPLIPGLNDSVDNIKAMSELLLSLGTDGARSIELMPYHRLGMGKYDALDREYPLKKLDMASTEAVELARQRFKEAGIDCLLSR
jgi:pyruvate formate lyase activating enzyme